MVSVVSYVASLHVSEGSVTRSNQLDGDNNFVNVFKSQYSRVNEETLFIDDNLGLSDFLTCV